MSSPHFFKSSESPASCSYPRQTPRNEPFHPSDASGAAALLAVKEAALSALTSQNQQLARGYDVLETEAAGLRTTLQRMTSEVSALRQQIRGAGTPAMHPPQR